MAIATSDFHRSLRGAVGDFIFRNYNGKTVVSLRPKYKNETNTEARRKARGNFRDATNFASMAMTNTKQKAYYTQKAKQLKLPNAYTAAVTDYMRRAKATVVTRSSFAAKKGDVIQISMTKGVFHIKEITITACTVNGDEIASQKLSKGDQEHSFKLILPDDWPGLTHLKIVSDEIGRKEYNVKREEFLGLLLDQ